MEDKLQDEFMEFWDSKKDILGLGNYSDVVLKFLVDKLSTERQTLRAKIEQKKDWYSGDGNLPIREALDSVISLIDNQENK